MERKISTTCYLDYVNLGKFDPSTFRNPLDRNAADYNDPDACCEELYKDLQEIYALRFLEMGYKLSRNEGEYFLWMDRDDTSFTMSSDFIGPSRAWAREAGVENHQVGEYLRKTRIIGGHVLWPVQGRTGNRNNILFTGRGGTINTCRGGTKGFCDRIDCTLQDLMNYYDCLNGENSIYKLSVFEKYKSWLLLFKNFRGFVDFFFLNDFCDSEYRVYDLETYDSVDVRYRGFIGESYSQIDYYKITDKKEYSRFIEGSVRAIELRQNRIKAYLSPGM